METTWTDDEEMVDLTPYVCDGCGLRFASRSTCSDHTDTCDVGEDFESYRDEKLREHEDWFRGER